MVKKMSNADLIGVLKSRKSRMGDILRKYGDAWLIISEGRNDSNVDYVLGTHTHGMIAVLVSPNDIYVLVNILEKSYVTDKPHIDAIDTYYGYKEFYDKLTKLLRQYSGMKILANFSSPEICRQASYLSYSLYNELKYWAKKYEFDLHPSGRFVYELRRTKTLEELNMLEKSVKITLDILDDIRDRGVIRAGVTERKIASELYKHCFLSGEPAFDVIVASGPNTANPHHVVSNRKIDSNDIVYIDFGVRYNTLSADITRVFYVGSIPKEVKDVYEVVYEAQNEAIKNIKAGVKGSEPDKIARKVIEKHGYDPKLFMHSLGHALGVDVHDVGPRLGKSVEQTIDANTAYTVEPALYFENKFGVRIEDDIIIYKDRVIRISKAPEEPILL